MHFKGRAYMNAIIRNVKKYYLLGCNIVYIGTRSINVSEEGTVSIFSVEEYTKQERNKKQDLLYRVHPIGYFLCGVTPQKRGHFQIPL
jgi:hypothetical protein